MLKVDPAVIRDDTALFDPANGLGTRLHRRAATHRGDRGDVRPADQGPATRTAGPANARHDPPVDRAAPGDGVAEAVMSIGMGHDRARAAAPRGAPPPRCWRARVSGCWCWSATAFPRFHVGESLIPYGNDVLRELGVWEKLEQRGLHAQARGGIHARQRGGHATLLFWPQPAARVRPDLPGGTREVRPSFFCSTPEEQGATVRQEAKVTALAADADGVRVSYDQDGSRGTRFPRAGSFDASGRTALAGHAFGVKQERPRPAEAARRLCPFRRGLSPCGGGGRPHLHRAAGGRLVLVHPAR